MKKLPPQRARAGPSSEPALQRQSLDSLSQTSFPTHGETAVTTPARGAGVVR